MPEFREQLAAIAAARAERRNEEDALYAARVELHTIQKRMTRAAQGTAASDGNVVHEDAAGIPMPDPDGAGALAGRARELERIIAGLGASVAQSESRVGGLIAGLYERDAHPRSTLAKLDDTIPFLLFPVRIETVFAPGAPGAAPELWVRIYPDDIVVHTHESTLTDAEVEAGELYWTEFVVAEHLRADRDLRRRAAWRHLVQNLSGPRAAWVTRQTKPAEWESMVADGEARDLIAFLEAAEPGLFDSLRATATGEAVRDALDAAVAAGDGDALMRLAADNDWGEAINDAARAAIQGFPEHDLTKTDAWTRAPRTRVMPDRFVLMLYADANSAPREIVGAPIPDVLTLGPDPLDAKAAFPEQDGALTYGPQFDWMSNFDKAVEQGMGFRVPLNPGEAAAGFAKIQVLGLMLSAGAEESARLVEELIDDHQFGPKGFSIVGQGTPTNNTEADGSGYSDNDRYDDLAFFSEIEPPAFDPEDPDPRRSQTDGRRLADALGVSYAPMQTLRSADRTDMLEAQAMNAALFPSTLGYWLRVWVAPVVDAATARRTRTFFNEYVTGRGPLPAVRVGDQPYGVLVTSDLARWKYPLRPPGEFTFVTLDDLTPFLSRLHGLVSQFAKRWDEMAASAAYVGKPGSDPQDVLMNLLGLHPTSVEFFQRIGYSDEYLRNLDAFKDKGRYAGELASLMRNAPPTARLYLDSLGFTPALADVSRMRAMHVLWQHYVTKLDAPNLVENRPPSDTDLLRVNYIDWLANAENFDKIINQDFSGPPQTSLLYLMLRNALMLQMHQGAYDWLVQNSAFSPELAAAFRQTTLPNVRAGAISATKVELMTTKVGAASSGDALAGASVANALWLGHNASDYEAAYVGEQKRNLAVLAGATTAALERAFVEHLDCCQYRLDAWETSLFAQRLAAQRRAGSQDRRMGIYLGAFGWVEQVTPTRKEFLGEEALPEVLRPADEHAILEEDDAAAARGREQGASRGGFVHAPSINHASASALLRSAYLGHANPDDAEMFSVNLSSSRVRRAEFVLQGMRNGQPIEALLGYQFERGLHDRTSASIALDESPLLELNQFVQAYRDSYPFEVREIAQAGDAAPSETVPAYNVVNGLKLSSASLSAANGYGLDGVLAPAERPDTRQGEAILAEQDALSDTLDAVKDLLMAENAYQLVLGNFDRVAAVSLAQKDARVPTTLQVIDTPRGATFGFTNRVTLHFDDLDASAPAANPWAPIAMTPRARAEPGLNAWLARTLAAASDKVLCEASRDNGADVRLVSLADLAIQPVDFVCLTALSPEQAGGASELETRIAYAYRRAAGVEDDVRVRISFNPAVDADAVTLAQLMTLARNLRGVIADSRPATAQDFTPAASGTAASYAVDKANPYGYDLADLRARVEAAFAELQSLADGFDGPGAPVVQMTLLNAPGDAGDDETFSRPLGAAMDKLEEAQLAFTDADRVSADIAQADAEALAERLRAVAAYGLADAFAPYGDLSDIARRREVLARAHRIARRLRRVGGADGVLDRAAAQIAEAVPGTSIAAQVKALGQAGEALFGATFKLMPAFTCFNDAELAAADAARGELLSFALAQNPGFSAARLVDEWLETVARVRPQIGRWELVRLLADSLGEVALEMRPVQAPYRAQDRWLAVGFPEYDPIEPEKPFGITRDTISIAACGAAAFRKGTRQRALLLDEWTEQIPTGGEITGVAFRYNQPNAVPPQTLLLAVTPDATGSWSWDDLVGTLSDTLARARRRAVEPAQLEQLGMVWNAFASALVSEFSSFAAGDVSLDLMVMQDYAPLNELYASFIKPSS